MNTPDQEYDTVPIPKFLAGNVLFGRYELKRRLGAGGYGIVWLALDRVGKEEIALKILPKIATEAEAVEDLRLEVRNGRKLNHDNIVRLHNLEVEPEVAAISMEFVDGDSMQGLRRGRKNKVFEAEALLPYLSQLCAGLTYAHQKEIIHRDLKPSNVMVSAKGMVKVADFGVSASISQTAKNVIKEARLSGTLQYMSPQQLKGEKPETTHDVYALGATCYDLLTGKPPFFRGHLQSIIPDPEQIPPSMAARRHELKVDGLEIPKHWEAAVAACLEKKPEYRPASVDEVFKCLSEPGKYRPPKRPTQPKPAPDLKIPRILSDRQAVKVIIWLCVLTGLLALLAIVFVYVVLPALRQPAQITSAPVTPAPVPPTPVAVATPVPTPRFIPTPLAVATVRPSTPRAVTPAFVATPTVRPSTPPAATPTLIATATVRPSSPPAVAPTLIATPAARPSSPAPVVVVPPVLATPAVKPPPPPTPAPPVVPPRSISQDEGMKIAQFISNHLAKEALLAGNRGDYASLLSDYAPEVEYDNFGQRLARDGIKAAKTKYFKESVSATETANDGLDISALGERDFTVTFRSRITRVMKGAAKPMETWASNTYVLRPTPGGAYQIIRQKTAVGPK